MKIQVDLDGDLWTRFKDKVQAHGKTLKEVVPGVLEPALRAYVDGPQEMIVMDGKYQTFVKDAELPIVDRVILTQKPRPTPTVMRCELCDMPTERLHHSEGKKVCYSCWKAAITAIPLPTPPTDHTPPEAA